MWSVSETKCVFTINIAIDVCSNFLGTVHKFEKYKFLKEPKAVR